MIYYGWWSSSGVALRDVAVNGSSRERRWLQLLTWDIHILRSVVTDVVVSGYLFSRFKILMPKRKARKSRFSSDDARSKAAGFKPETEDERYERLCTTRERMAIWRTQDTEERGCVLRGKGWLFQGFSIPKNVAAYYEGKDGYFKKSVYRRT